MVDLTQDYIKIGLEPIVLTESELLRVTYYRGNHMMDQNIDVDFFTTKSATMRTC